MLACVAICGGVEIGVYQVFPPHLSPGSGVHMPIGSPLQMVNGGQWNGGGNGQQTLGSADQGKAPRTPMSEMPDLVPVGREWLGGGSGGTEALSWDGGEELESLEGGAGGAAWDGGAQYLGASGLDPMEESHYQQKAANVTAMPPSLTPMRASPAPDSSSGANASTRTDGAEGFALQTLSKMMNTGQGEGRYVRLLRSVCLRDSQRVCEPVSPSLSMRVSASLVKWCHAVFSFYVSDLRTRHPQQYSLSQQRGVDSNSRGKCKRGGRTSDADGSGITCRD